MGKIKVEIGKALLLCKAKTQKTKKEIEKMENKETTVWKEIEALCKDCPAWSGTDCTQNPYTDDCLKENKTD